MYKINPNRDAPGCDEKNLISVSNLISVINH